METTIGAWGNSDAVRIPKEIMRRLKLGRGDRVSITANERGVIEITPIVSEHRSIAPKRGVTFESLFHGYSPAAENTEPAWPDDNLMGAEWDAWAQ